MAREPELDISKGEAWMEGKSGYISPKKLAEYVLEKGCPKMDERKKAPLATQLAEAIAPKMDQAILNRDKKGYQQSIRDDIAELRKAIDQKVTPENAVKKLCTKSEQTSLKREATIQR